jgi:type VI secretion system secreted protein VgrG
MEVLVTFLAGDPDRPVVIGSLYNATHATPDALPVRSTRSGIRTQSSPGGGGFNELSFEDAAGREQIYVHAQRNLDEKVGKNHTQLVQNDEFIRILGNRMDTIERNLESLVKGDQTSRVEGDQTSHVDGNRIDVVKGNSDERVSGTLATRVEGKERRGVTGRSDLTLADDYTVRVKGCYTTIVGRNDAKRSYVLRVEGTGQLSSSGVMEIDAEKGLTLKCGKSFIKITADKIELAAPSVSAKGEGGGIVVDNDIKLNAKGDAILKAKSLLVKTEEASMSLKTDVQIDGKKIL